MKGHQKHKRNWGPSDADKIVKKKTVPKEGARGGTENRQRELFQEK